MNLLMTGATGLIGRNLVEQLLKNNQTNIIALTRKITHAKKAANQDLKWISSLDQIDFNALDGIINLAGEPIADRRWSTTQKKKIYDSRIQLTTDIAERVASSSHKPSFVINASAVGYYGRQQDSEITEDFDQPNPEFTHRLCKDWESAALEMASETTRVAVLRFGIVLSPQGGALKKMLLPFRMGLGGKLGSGKQWMSWIHIQDVVKCILWIIDHSEANGVFNTTAPHPVTNQTFSNCLSSTLKRPCLFHQPEPMIRLLFGEMADILLFGQKVIPTRIQKMGFEFNFPRLPEALDDLISR